MGRVLRRGAALATVLIVVGSPWACGGRVDDAGADGGRDGSPTEASADAARPGSDAGTSRDAVGPVDSGSDETTVLDSASPDAVAFDSASPDSAASEAAALDSGMLDSPGSDGAATDAEGPDSAGAEAGGDAASEAGSMCTNPGGCDTLVNCAPQVDIQTVVGMAPTPTGGAVPAGTYVMSQLTIYEPTPEIGTGPWFRETMQIGTTDASGAASWVDSSSNNSMPQGQTSAGTMTFSGTNLAVTYACPSGMTEFTAGYTFSGGMLLMYVPLSELGQGFTEQIVYTPM